MVLRDSWLRVVSGTRQHCVVPSKVWAPHIGASSLIHVPGIEAGTAVGCQARRWNGDAHRNNAHRACV